MKKLILPLLLILSTIQLIGQTVLDPNEKYNYGESIDFTPNKEYMDSIYGDSVVVVIPLWNNKVGPSYSNDDYVESTVKLSSYEDFNISDENLFRDGTSTINLVDNSVPYYFDQSDERISLKDSLSISFKEWGRMEHVMGMDNYITFDIIGYDNFPKNIHMMCFTWFVDDNLAGKEYLYLGERYNILESKLNDNPQYDQITYKVASLRKFKKFKKYSKKPSINLTVVITIKDKENNIYDCSKTLRLYYDNDKGWYVLSNKKIIPIWKI